MDIKFLYAFGQAGNLQFDTFILTYHMEAVEFY